MTMTERRGMLIMFAYLIATGCSTLPLLPKPTPSAGTPTPNVREDGYEDYVGVIHIHTKYSDGAGTYEEIARIANAQRLDYLIVTDHNTLRPLREGKQGWYGGTLVLVGTEISTRAGHYLALNVTQEINRQKLTTQQIIDEVNRQGGLGFIAHPYFKKRRWTDWTVHGFTGIEGYNLAHDTLDENRLRLALWTLTVPVEPFYLSLIDRPYDPLSTWDQLIRQRGPLVGIGSSDAHELRFLGLKFAPYEIMFHVIRTHLLIPSTHLTAPSIYDALRRGHAYFSIELLAEAKGFSFMAENDQRIVGIMGDEIPLQPHLQLTTSLPAVAQITLMKDGEPAQQTTAQVWRVPITEAGTYRIEVTRDRKPWIYSNPIYVRPSVPIVDSPQQHNE